MKNKKKSSKIKVNNDGTMYYTTVDFFKREELRESFQKLKDSKIDELIKKNKESKNK